MRIAIVGVGGIGAYIGSKLCKLTGREPGLEITFIQRGQHLQAIKERGLTYITKTETTVWPSFITDTPADAGILDLVIFNVKSRDLDDAARSVRGNLHDKTVLLSTLNGVNNAQRIQGIYPASRVLNGCIYVSAAIEKPGVVRQMGGAGALFFGPEDGKTEPYKGIEDLLKETGIKAVLSDNIIKDVWDKYIFICSWASISSKYGLPVGDLLANETIVDEWGHLLREIRDVAFACKVSFEEDTTRNCLDRARALPRENKTSMQLDIELGKQPEIDLFTSFVSKMGKEKGVDTPYHDAILHTLGY